MRGRYDDRRDPDLRDVVAQYRDRFRGPLRWLGPLLFVAVVLVLGFLGFFTVGPGEIGIVRTFGRMTGQVGPGPHFAFPIVQQYDVVNVERIRRAEIGFRTKEEGVVRVPGESLMLTGDANILEAQVIIQYLIADPAKYLFQLKDPEVSLHVAAEVALRSVVGQTVISAAESEDEGVSGAKIDPSAPLDILTTGRDEAQIRTKQSLQQLMDLYESGIRITEVKLQVVDAPDEVKDAFHDVVRAREEREQKINKARGYREDQLPRARGQAQKILRAAEAYKQERVLRAQGEAARFGSQLAEYEKAKEVTRRRLHLETMERILGKVKHKVIIDEEVAGNALPLLSLGDGARIPAPAPVQGGQEP